jgi:hypothetical protein
MFNFDALDAERYGIGNALDLLGKFHKRSRKILMLGMFWDIF